MADHVKTRFLLLSDTHAHVPSPTSTTSFPDHWPFPAADVAIHTGDLTMTGQIHEHEQAVDLLKQLPTQVKIVIPGNHDLTLDAAYYASKGHIHGPVPKYSAEQLQYIRDLYTGAEAQAANIIYLEEGIRTIQLENGATLTVYASAYTPEFCDWAFAYPRDQDRFNLPGAASPVPSFNLIKDTGNNVDVMLTHGPPLGILDQVQEQFGRAKIIHVGCENLLQAVKRAKPLLHCFGHIHEGWGAARKVWADEVNTTRSEESQDTSKHAVALSANVSNAEDDPTMYKDSTDIERGRETLFVNSSITNLHYKPVQPPWVVDLLLTVSSAGEHRVTQKA